MALRKKVIFAIPAAVILYYVTGLVFTLSGFVKSWPVFPGGPVIQYTGGDSHQYAQDKPVFEDDGPYVFYQNDSVLVTSIHYRDTLPYVVSKSYSVHSNETPVISCTFKDPEWNFTTQLNDSLTVQSSVFHNITRIAAISDVEGNFGAFREWLINNTIIDSSYQWTFGTGHLVLGGDFFDRGTQVTECLWLIHDLEQKAKRAGGYVHFILGNHEIMNMSGDFRYVRKKYHDHAKLMNRSYASLYKPGTELGNWLASKNVVEVIGPVLFTHGGISESLAALMLAPDDVNILSRPYYFIPRKDQPNEEPVKTLFSSKASPFWNRDYVMGGVSESFIDRVLKQYEVQRIVIGHTLVDNVTMLFSGKVIAIDTDHTSGSSQGFLFENGNYFSIDRKGTKILLLK